MASVYPEAKSRAFANNKIILFLRKHTMLILFFILWEISPRIGLVDDQFIPSLSTVLVTIFNLAQSGELFIHVGYSLRRALLGFAFASAIAIPLGFMLGGAFTTLEEISDSLLQVLAQINPFSVFPVFMLFFGIGETTKVAIIFWVSIWPILFNTIQGVRNIDPLLIKAATTMGTRKFTLFWKVILPAAAPSIFTGIRMGAGNSFFMLIAAEMIGSSAGLGWMVLNSQVNYQIPKLYAAAVTIAVLGITINRLILRAERNAIKGRENAFSTN